MKGLLNRLWKWWNKPGYSWGDEIFRYPFEGTCNFCYKRTHARFFCDYKSVTGDCPTCGARVKAWKAPNYYPEV